MLEKSKIYKVRLLTPCFCKGADKNSPEIRPPSIRGMIRKWVRLRGEKPDAVWGGPGRNASKVSVSVDSFGKLEADKTLRSPLLPHKGNPRAVSIKEGTTFTMNLTRLVGCSDELWKKAKRDVETWLLLGCLGQRANRAAGSVWCEYLNFHSKRKEMLLDNYYNIKVFDKLFDKAEDARTTASDTVKDETFFGNFSPRIPSPIKMKVIPFERKYKLLWVTEKKYDFMEQALQALKRKQDPKRWQDMEFEN